uniref:Putative secreted protein n=1 Tax=Amblyomma cajennense TaxID=34607 RepID=A0A023FDX6_AMBCJ
MQTVFFFFLLATIAYVQCRPSEEVLEAAGTGAVEEKDFCKDIRKADQVLFLGCISGMVPEADKVMKENGGDVHSLLKKICSENGDHVQNQMLKALEMSDEAIEVCSELIQ